VEGVKLVMLFSTFAKLLTTAALIVVGFASSANFKLPVDYLGIRYLLEKCDVGVVHMLVLYNTECSLCLVDIGRLLRGKVYEHPI